MRTYKFRAFDRRIGKMIQTGIQFNNTTMELNSTPDLILMQFTGLLDKKGKEIYGGDILEVVERRLTYIVEVFWDKNSAMFQVRCEKPHKDYGYLFEFIPDEFDKIRLEIIGNIYENEDLIK